MGIVQNTDWKCIKELLGPVEQVLSYDLEKLKQMDKIRRTEIWENIVANQQKFEDGICGDIERDINEEINGKFSMAKLLIATAAYDNKEKSPIIKEFSDTEINLVKELERFAVFEILSIDEIVEKIRGREVGLFELLEEYIHRIKPNLDDSLRKPTLPPDLRIAFENRYSRINKKMNEVIKASIERSGVSFSKK